MTAPATKPLLDKLTQAAVRDGIVKTVVGAVIADQSGNVLLLHRTSDDFLPGLWELPSGGVEPGENLLDALCREVTEETGLMVTAVGDYLGHFDYLSGSGRLTRQHNFAATVTAGQVVLTEHDAHQWADHSAQDLVTDAVQQVLATWREHGACPGRLPTGS